MVTDMTSMFKGAKYLGVKNIETMKKGGQYLYLLCEGENLVVYDTQKGDCEAEINLPDKIDGTKENGRVRYSLLFANEEGAFVALNNNEEENWIVLIDSTGKVEILKKLNTMGGNIEMLFAINEYIFFPYNDSDYDKRGSYRFHRKTNEVTKRTDQINYGAINLFQNFVWNNHYGFVSNGGRTLYLIPFDGDNPIEVNFEYSSRSICVDGDYLYRGHWKSLERYNLRTGEFEVANREGYYGLK